MADAIGALHNGFGRLALDDVGSLSARLAAGHNLLVDPSAYGACPMGFAYSNCPSSLASKCRRCCRISRSAFWE